MTDHVTAVVVTHGMSPYLEATLTALAAQARPADRVLVVDWAEPADPAAGERTVGDVVAALWTADDATVIAAPDIRSFGDGVRVALFAHPQDSAGRWLWLLHDDAAPDADALGALMRAVEVAPSVGIAGCKQHTWDEPARVLEVGLSTSRFGRRMTGLDAPEVDQGQHDGREDVLGVGTAGMLVRQGVWEDLGGTDPALGPYGDGLDLSRRARLAGHRVIVVPGAVVRHAQASLVWQSPDGQGQRAGWDARRSAQARREAYLHSQLVGVPAVLVPVVVALALVSGPVRALGRFAIKEPHLVTAELGAPWAVLVRPHRIVRARRTAASSSRIHRRDLRPLQVTWREVLSQQRDRRLTAVEQRRRRRAPSELELRELAALNTRRRAVLGVVLIVATTVTVVVLGPVIARVLTGARLTGGTLPFGDAGVGDLWAAIRSGWVGGELGAPGPSDPLLLALFPLTALTGTVGRSAAVVLLASLVLSAAGAWFAAGAATRSVGLRAWAALVWAGAPVLLLAVQEVRLGAVLAHVALPWVVLGVARAVGVARVDVVESGLVGAQTAAADESVAPVVSRTAEPSLAAAAGAGLAFVVVVAGAPILLPLGLLALTGVAALSRRRRRLVWVVLPALAVNGPLLAAAVATWSDGGWRTLLADPGLTVAAPGEVPPWYALVGWPTGLPGWVDLPTPYASLVPLVATGVVVAGALVALAVGGPAGRAVRVGWLVVACGLTAVVVGDRLQVAVAADRTVSVWPGPAADLVLVGVLTAALVGASGARAAIARHSFGWRQVCGALAMVLAVAGPAAVVGSWSWSARLPGELAMVTSTTPVVPAVGRHLQDEPEGARVLSVTAGADGGSLATVLRHDGVQLTEVSRAVSGRALTGSPGTASVRDPDAGTLELADVVARLVTGVTTDVAADLAALGIGALLVPPVSADGADLVDAHGSALPDDDDPARRSARAALVGVADSTPGLDRVTQTESGVLWRVVPPAGTTTAWARLLAAGSGTEGELVAALPSRDGAVDTELPPADGTRVLVLAERADRGWRATLDGRPLRVLETTWRQAFEIGPDGGRLVVAHEADGARTWLVLQGAVLLVSALLALPVRRRRGAV